MHRYGLLVLNFLLLTLLLHSQEHKIRPVYEPLYMHAEKLMQLESPGDITDSIALSNYLQVITLLKKGENNTVVLADSYLKCGILKMSTSDPAAAYSFFMQSIAVIHLHHLPDSLLFKPYLYSGSIQYDQNNLDSAVYYYKKAEAVTLQYAFIDESERLYNKLGALYYETGDYKKSIGYFEKALSIVTQKKPLNIFFIVNYKNNIATALLKMGAYKKALQVFNEILPYHIAEDQLFYNTGNAYTEEEAYTKALQYFRQIKQMDLEKNNSLAKVFIRLHQFDSASWYLLKAEKAFADKKNHTKKIDFGITLKYKGDAAAGIAGTNEAPAASKERVLRYLSAIHYYQQAITYFDPVFSDTAISSNPSSFTGLRNFSNLFDALTAKAIAFNKLYELQADIQMEDQALNAFSSALALAKHAERAYFSDDARLFLKNKVNPATRNAVETALTLFNHTKNTRYIEMAFNFAETNKASVLQNGLRDLELLSVPGLPEKLVTEEKKYKLLLGKLMVESNRITDSLSAASVQEKIHENELALTTVQEKLDENPFYHQLKFTNNHAGIKELQQKLQKGEIILSYYYTNKYLICFYIEKETSGFSSVILDSTFFKTIITLRKGLESPEAYTPGLLANTSAALFKKLIAPLQDKIKYDNRLIIIPYNEIGYIPFEIMLDDAGGSMLLDKYSISYQYAAGFLTDKNAGLVRDYNVLAMAPFFKKDDAGLLPFLPASAGEINYLPGKQLYGAEATKQQFLNLSGRYPIVHLATHALANDTNLLGSFIEFYGVKKDADTMHRVYEPEIYSLDLKPVRLVILSACETGNGLLVNGEGVMSLSRAFSYAGCKSVITSLWKADDIATAFIIKRLHYYLQKGLAKDEALQKAKLDYLKSNEIEDRFKNPAYWGHLVLIGEYQPLVKPLFRWWIPVLIIALLAVAFVLLRKKKDRA